MYRSRMPQTKELVQMSSQKTQAYFRALEDAEDARERRIDHAKQMLAFQENSRWLGQHVRPEPDYNGWIEFEVYAKRNAHSGERTFYWSAADDYGSPKGFEHGPFPTAKEAYNDAST
jgi:hypothetical protein